MKYIFFLQCIQQRYQFKNRAQIYSFFTQLLALFKFCPTCKSDDVLVDVLQNGTMAQVKVTCSNQKCGKRDSTWNSQPVMTGTSIPAGNLLLSFGILTSGTSATKFIRALEHIGIACISLSTHFTNQRVSN